MKNAYLAKENTVRKDAKVWTLKELKCKMKDKKIERKQDKRGFERDTKCVCVCHRERESERDKSVKRWIRWKRFSPYFVPS